ncbi:MAG: tetratricopeptide repeat protein [Ferruginibacter sp.]
MAADKKVQSAKFTDIDDVDIIEKAKGFWEKFNLPIIYTGSAIIILLLGWVVYKNYIKDPKEEKAAEALFPAEHLFGKMASEGFNKDSIDIVLNGANGLTGVVKIANTYSGTAAGNIADYLAGACYLHEGEFEKAVKYLKDFSTKATQLQTEADMMLGDAYSELKKNDDALSAYEKASSVNEKDEFMTPNALFRQGLFAETIGKTDEAIACYQKIKDNYPKSSHAGDMDKYLAKLGVLK